MPRMISDAHDSDDDIPESGRDERGRWTPGVSGNPNGRPPHAVDLRQAAEKMAGRAGIDLEVAVGKVIGRLLASAVDGDVAAARAVLDRLCGPVPRDPTAVAIAQVGGAGAYRPLSDVERAVRIRELLAIAAGAPRDGEQGADDAEEQRLLDDGDDDEETATL